MFENYLNFRRKSEHKTSVWWSSFWASTTLSRSCPRKRATNPAREGWHEKFPVNPPWRKLRMRSRRSAGGTRSRCWPTSRCGSTLSPTNQARARNPTSSPSERSASCSINQRIPQHNEGLSPPNWCNTANPRQISLKRKLRPDFENANVIRHSLRHHFSCLISLSSPFTDESWVSYWRWMTVDQRRCGLVGSSVSVLSVLLFLTRVYCIKFCVVL